MESEVKSYSRIFPSTFYKSYECFVEDIHRKRYLDFLSGCGALNYGHNHPELKSALVSYIEGNGIAMSMDLMTEAKERFIQKFSEIILAPRGLNYRLQFTGPTGANAIETSLKLARKITGRQNIIAFTNAFHGCSLGALSVTGSAYHRSSSTPLLNNITRLAFDGYFGKAVDTTDMLEKLLNDPSSGIDAPAAIIFEVVQGEGGLNCCTSTWVQKIQKIAKKHGALVIVDEIQSGCGRSGSFFAFESHGIQPDIICMAKAISGYGLPMSLVLIKPEIDIWKPGEHNGTFRGNNHAFVTAAKALDLFWSDSVFERVIEDRSKKIESCLYSLSESYPDKIKVKGKGMMMGLEFSNHQAPKVIQEDCFSKGLIIELCGPNDEVLKLLPPLNIEEKYLHQGLSIIREATHNKLAGINTGPSQVKYG